jgi:hypothetical protein
MRSKNSTQRTATTLLAAALAVMLAHTPAQAGKATPKLAPVSQKRVVVPAKQNPRPAKRSSATKGLALPDGYKSQYKLRVTDEYKNKYKLPATDKYKDRYKLPVTDKYKDRYKFPVTDEYKDRWAPLLDVHRDHPGAVNGGQGPDGLLGPKNFGAPGCGKSDDRSVGRTPWDPGDDQPGFVDLCAGRKFGGASFLGKESQAPEATGPRRWGGTRSDGDLNLHDPESGDSRPHHLSRVAAPGGRGVVSDRRVTGTIEGDTFLQITREYKDGSFLVWYTDSSGGVVMTEPPKGTIARHDFDAANDWHDKHGTGTWKPDGEEPDGEKPDGEKPDGEKPDGDCSSPEECSPKLPDQEPDHRTPGSGSNPDDSADVPDIHEEARRRTVRPWGQPEHEHTTPSLWKFVSPCGQGGEDCGTSATESALGQLQRQLKYDNSKGPHAQPNDL